MVSFNRLRMGLLTALVFLSSCTDALRTHYTLPPFRTDVAKRDVVMLPMRDGIKLATDVYLPEGEGPWPTILIRDPYNAFDVVDPINRILTRYGYAVVHQDVRGRLRSEGEWMPVVHEAQDGKDTLDWVLQQPFFDGNLALYGPSYLGIAQWAMLADLPPEVKTIVPQVSSTNLHDAVYEDGMFRHEFLSFWASAMPHASVAPFNLLTYQSAIRDWPNDENAIHLGDDLQWYREWQHSPSPSAALWQHPDLKRMPQAVRDTHIPMLFVGAQYDIFFRDQLKDFARIGSHDQSRYVIGPWTHLMGFYGDGQKPFDDAEGFGMLDAKVLNWFDHHLKGMPLDDWGPLWVYRIGEGWQAHNAWPTPKPWRLHLGGARKARRCEGGQLDHVAPSYRSEVPYTYDPEDPVPTRGGSQLLAWVLPPYGGAPASNRDQSGLCERDDVLTFMTPRLGSAVRLSGPIRVRLRVKSTAEDTSFTAKLIEVDADGKALNIRDGITSLAWRNGAVEEQTYVPGDDVDVVIDLTRIEWAVQPGSRLRLDISSSNFPAFHAHPNVAGVWSEVERPQVAQQTLVLGQGASVLELGVLD